MSGENIMAISKKSGSGAQNIFFPKNEKPFVEIVKIKPLKEDENR